MSGELVRIDFYGDTLEACQRDGKVWVSLNRLCEAMGVDIEGQRKKIKKAEWATSDIIAGVAEDGKRRDVTVIDLDTLPGWLFSLNAGKVREEVRAKLVRYQREAARVLADHFTKRTAPPPEIDPLLAAAVVISDLRARVAALEVIAYRPKVVRVPKALKPPPSPKLTDADRRRRVIEVMRSGPEWMTADEVIDRLTASGVGFRRQAVLSILSDVCEKSGKGVKGQPTRHRLGSAARGSTPQECGEPEFGTAI